MAHTMKVILEHFYTHQRAKKLTSDSPVLVDFPIGLMDFILHLQSFGDFFEEINLIPCIFENVFRLMKITSGLANYGYSLKIEKKKKMNFFVPCVSTTLPLDGMLVHHRVPPKQGEAIGEKSVLPQTTMQ